VSHSSSDVSPGEDSGMVGFELIGDFHYVDGILKIKSSFWVIAGSRIETREKSSLNKSFG
jgi:hypothetical protein